MEISKTYHTFAFAWWSNIGTVLETLLLNFRGNFIPPQRSFTIKCSSKDAQSTRRSCPPTETQRRAWGGGSGPSIGQKGRLGAPCSVYGCFLKWWNPPNTPKWSFLVGKSMVVGYRHHFRKPPYHQQTTKKPAVIFFDRQFGNLSTFIRDCLEVLISSYKQPTSLGTHSNQSPAWRSGQT